MPLRLLLLLVLLGLGLGLPESQGNGDEDDWGGYDDGYVTDPPEMLETITAAVTPRPERQAAMGTLGPRDSAGPGTPEPATLEATTGDSAGLDARGATPGKLSVELATQGIPVTPGPLATELGTTIPPITEAPSTEGAPSTELATAKALPTEPLTTQPAATEALTTEPLATHPAATEALTMHPAATEALSTSPAATEALSTSPAATEALSTSPAATESLSMESTVTETLSTEPATTAAPPTAPPTTETLSKEPGTMQALSTAGLSTALLVLPDAHGGATVAATVAVRNSSDAFIKRGKSSQGLSPPSSAPPSLTRGPDYMPVKHCLLAILILALVATTFLVCTVVLAVRLSRRNHMYHVRSYSPTEMVCISSLLAEGGEAPAVTANGSLPAAKGPGLKEGAGEDHSGDDLTLHSFLP
ncbi:P-selectin glycoprotein ligand 1 [Eptesicus fuscus]|uniref:P-selectin glycoprotein ligand 1 n=1 Tax=Eptesicus fuscus TaxID=29078 RepID=UPI002403AC14|nr:P-selectin glycoprotein ligand 1 [Eptesicus fuscus]